MPRDALKIYEKMLAEDELDEDTRVRYAARVEELKLQRRIAKRFEELATKERATKLDDLGDRVAELRDTDEYGGARPANGN